MLGPGGIGKTVLALRIASNAAGDFADGAWMSTRPPRREANMVERAILRALGIEESANRSLSETLNLALADRHALILLDNC